MDFEKKKKRIFNLLQKKIYKFFFWKTKERQSYKFHKKKWIIEPRIWNDMQTYLEKSNESPLAWNRNWRQRSSAVLRSQPSPQKRRNSCRIMPRNGDSRKGYKTRMKTSIFWRDFGDLSSNWCGSKPCHHRISLIVPWSHRKIPRTMVNNENTIVRSKLKRGKEILVDSSVVRRRAHYPKIDNPLAHLIDPWSDNYIHVLLCFLPLII